MLTLAPELAERNRWEGVGLKGQPSMLHDTLLTLVPLITGLGSAGLAIWIDRRLRSPAAAPCALLFVGLAVWLLAQSVSNQLVDPHDKNVLAKIEYVGIVIIPLALLLVAARASQRDGWVGPRSIAALCILPAVTLLAVVTNERHGLIWQRITSSNDPLAPWNTYHHGVGFWVYAAYAYAQVATASWLLAAHYRHDRRHCGVEAFLVLGGILAPWVSNAVYLSGWVPVAGFDPTPYAFTLSAVLFTLGFARGSILEPPPLIRGTVVQDLGDALLVVGPTGHLLDFNAAARQILQPSPTAARLCHTHDALRHHGPLLACLDGTRSADSRGIEIETPEGLRIFDVRVSDLHAEGVGFSGRLVVLRDVTEYERARAAAQAATVAKSQFLANMSHEIRTPMNGVLGLAEDLQHRTLDVDQRQLVDDILASGRALVQIIDDILDFSKIEAGKLRIDHAPFSLGGVLDEARRLLAPRVRQAGIALEIDPGADLPGWLRGDASRVRQILLNLMSNAVKFTKVGRVCVRVRSNLEGPGMARLWICVSDTGIGIPDAALARIFDPFTQADGSTTRRFGGTGLGLAITKQLVDLMGGEIGVESAEGEGSTFWLVLRLPICGAPEVVKIPAASSAGQAPGDAPLRILAAEDNAVNQRVLSRLLERLGCQVEIAADGQEALEKARAGGWDLVLMDCQMPVLDGFAATRAIRALAGDAAKVPIVAVTAHALAGDRERCLAEGMDDYLTKPVSLASLEQVLARLSLRRTHELDPGAPTERPE